MGSVAMYLFTFYTAMVRLFCFVIVDSTWTPSFECTQLGKRAHHCLGEQWNNRMCSKGCQRSPSSRGHSTLATCQMCDVRAPVSITGFLILRFDT
eukprot:1207737-Amphidinium_carterae.1